MQLIDGMQDPNQGGGNRKAQQRDKGKGKSKKKHRQKHQEVEEQENNHEVETQEPVVVFLSGLTFSYNKITQGTWSRDSVS